MQERSLLKGLTPLRRISISVAVQVDNFDLALVDRAKANGLICNLFFADDEEMTLKYLKMGMDTILTNDYHRISNVVNKYIIGDEK